MLAEFRRLLLQGIPEGRSLPESAWRRRHRGIVVVLYLHVLGVAVFGLLSGHSLAQSLIESAPVAAFAAAAALIPGRGRKFKASMATLGLLTSSAVLVQLANGSIEMHFHFFVMLAVIALYQDWFTYLLAITFVVLHHGIGGAIAPQDVYDHADAWANAWKWAGIHAAFVAGASVAYLVSWRLNEVQRAQAELILEAAGDGIYGVDLQGKPTFANPAAAQMLDRELDELLATSPHELMGHGGADGALFEQAGCAICAAANDGRSSPIQEGTLQRRDGSRFPIEYVVTPVWDHERPGGVVVAFQDITARKQAEESLKKSESGFRLLFADNPHPMWVYDAETLGFLEVNDAAVDHYGYKRAEFLAMRITELHPEEDVPALLADVARTRTGLQRGRQWRHRLKDGEVLDVETSSHRVQFAARPAVLAVAQDVTERVRLAQQLERQAFTDPLTGLPNRPLFMDRLAHAVERAQTQARPMAVLFVDLDRFKLVNDTLGHAAGDALLVAAAERLHTCVGTGDTVARIGGDEFIVLLEEISGPAAALEAAERLVSAFQQAFCVADREFYVTVSVGVACRAEDNGTAEELLREADVALYQAKASGRSCALAYDPVMNTETAERLGLEADLRRAIERGEFVLHYQPDVDLESGRIRGVEALVRWQHPERGLVPPGEFIPLAEETGLILPIGRWVLREACRQAALWRREQPRVEQLVMSVNLSARQLQDPEFVNQVARVLEETGLPPHCLLLELTETTVMRRVEEMIPLLQALKGLGVQLAIDDFGTGYSSLSHLARFPVDTLKVDQSFVRRLSADAGTAAIVEATIALAHALNMEVTAEGIEIPEQLLRLQRQHCDRGQGFYFSHPLPATDVAELFADPLPRSLVRSA